MSPEVEACVETWPDDAQRQFRRIRGLVFTVAERAEVGTLEETLKWGQPSWLPQKKRLGSTLRCTWHPGHADRISLYVNCNTSLVETLRSLYPDTFEYEGRRGLHMPLNLDLPVDAVDHCAFLTLTYHRKSA